MKKFRKAFAALMMMLVVLCVFSTPVEAKKSHPDRVVDEADVLTSAEFDKLTSKVDRISEKYEIDVCIVTEYYMTGYNAQASADDIYDYGGYGMGSDDSGIMLYISTFDNDWAITTYGKAKKIFTDKDLDEIISEFKPYLSKGNFYEGFNTFAEACEKEIKDDTSFHFVRYLLISILVGLVVAIIYILVLWSKLRSVRAVDSAANYVVNGSLNITNGRELYLYRTLQVTKRETSSGTTTHTSSSGRSHGGASGKF